ncbi:hypothetical protein WNB94_11065 [Aquabacterium sp. A3]|uniref:hypothetical protein n=1 Tax=Aquabacterium sp. A3 TaxID=3132829 RepID=UPI0031196107
MTLSLRTTTVALLVLASSLPAAMAGTTTSSHQSRLGVQVNLPFDGSGFKFQQTTLHLVFQKADVSQSDSVNGWQVSVGSRLNSFTPFFGASALRGSRCTYVSVGVSYGAGQWGLPLFINGPFSSLGLLNQGGLGGLSAGVGSLDCFDRYVPATPAASVTEPDTPPVLIPQLPILQPQAL